MFNNDSTTTPQSNSRIFLSPPLPPTAGRNLRVNVLRKSHQQRALVLPLPVNLVSRQETGSWPLQLKMSIHDKIPDHGHNIRRVSVHNPPATRFLEAQHQRMRRIIPATCFAMKQHKAGVTRLPNVANTAGISQPPEELQQSRLNYYSIQSYQKGQRAQPHAASQSTPLTSGPRLSHSLRFPRTKAKMLSPILSPQVSGIAPHPTIIPASPVPSSRRKKLVDILDEPSPFLSRRRAYRSAADSKRFFRKKKYAAKELVAKSLLTLSLGASSSEQVIGEMTANSDLEASSGIVKHRIEKRLSQTVTKIDGGAVVAAAVKARTSAPSGFRSAYEEENPAS